MNNTVTTMKGAARSITMWAGGLLFALGQFAPYVDAGTLASVGIDGKTARICLTVAAVITWACRVITTQSLADKAAPAPLPPTSTQEKSK